MTVMQGRVDEILVRTAISSDVPEMISLVNPAFAVETFLDGTRTDEERMSEMMRTGDLLLAEYGGRAAACVYVELREDRGYFGLLAVDPAQQGTGMGRLMVSAAEQYCREHGCKHVDITVLSLRPELPPFYRKLGYVEFGTEEFRPSRPLKDRVECHCIVMSKVL